MRRLDAVRFDVPGGDECELSFAGEAEGVGLEGVEAASLVRWSLRDAHGPSDAELSALLGLATFDDAVSRHELVERIAAELEHGATSRLSVRRRVRARPRVDPGRVFPIVDLRELLPVEPEPVPTRAPDVAAEPPSSLQPTFIDIVVLDALGQPRVDVLFELVLPDTTIFTGRTGSDGRIRLDDLTIEGDCELTFPELAAA